MLALKSPMPLVDNESGVSSYPFNRARTVLPPAALPQVTVKTKSEKIIEEITNDFFVKSFFILSS